jgi:arylsulfatase A-like enzyme
MALGCLVYAPVTLISAPTKPNIIYILADDMGYGDPGFMGSKDLLTPNLDRLAREGSVLSSYYVQPVCSPTRSTIMTGRLVIHTGVYSVIRPGTKWGLPLAERTLPQALQEAGYETAITGKWHLGHFLPEYLPTNRGFDHQYGHYNGAIDYFTHIRDGVPDWHRDDQPSTDEGYSTHLLAKEACRLIRERNPAKPLFLYLPFNAVHGPFQVPESYIKPFDQLTGVRKTYAGMVAAMDEAVGQVLAALDEAKMRENTLIIFSSDNGGPAPGRITDNGPLRAGKGSIYEGGIRVCAAVSWPGHIPAGKTITEPLQGVDWFPTLVTLAGGSLNQKLPLDGKDILPVLTAGAKSPHEALLLSGIPVFSVAIRAGDWKLLLNPTDQGAGSLGDANVDRNHVELYNLANDIGEKQDLAKTNPGKVKELRARLDAWMKDAVTPGEVDGKVEPAK